MKDWADEYGAVFHMRLLTAHVRQDLERLLLLARHNFAACSPTFCLQGQCLSAYGHLPLQVLVVSDPRVATEVLQMPKVMDKNRQALVTLDLVRCCQLCASIVIPCSCTSSF